MAEKRMFTQKIVDSDAFLDMPLSTQALYFHLNMRADDDGFVNNPKRIQRTVGASEDDLKLLIAKRFLLCFENGVIVIKHWRMHNTLRKDRYNPTVYQEQYALLDVKENNSYTEKTVATSWQPDGNQLEPQYRLDKDSIDYISPSGDIAADAASSASAEQSNKVDFSFSSASAEQPTQNSYSAPSALPKADRGDSITMPKAKSSINRNSGAPKYPKKAESPSDDLDRYLHPKFENMPKKGRSGGFDYKEAWEAALARSGIEYE